MPIMIEESADPMVLIFLIAICVLVFAVSLRLCFSETIDAIDEFFADKIRGDD